MKRSSLVYVSFPKTGLGNLLLVWARAKVFSHRHSIPLITSAWWGIRWGSWLRNEQKKRLYWGYFRGSSIQNRVKARVACRVLPVIREPEDESANGQPSVYFFSTIVTENDLFKTIRPYRSLVLAEIINLLKPELQKKWPHLSKPEMAVHIRRGDFVKGNPITPVFFFVQCIEFVRKLTRYDLAVTVFTDARPEEIGDVLQLKNVALADAQPDILDLLQMSQSRILVLSQSSTFSYWAAFLSEAIVIKSAGDWQGDLRPSDVNRHRFEGKIAFDQPETLEPLRWAIQKEAW
ncbi:alpha-1,2-fucosyltransferase [Flavisolibacter sp. BT320]|nr:alpha-1,2-fucosyltransferase [Flavisolibacter longurius]